MGNNNYQRLCSDTKDGMYFSETGVSRSFYTVSVVNTQNFQIQNYYGIVVRAFG